jgi:1-deoxy-D-xylulose-5-phosphate synthase
MYTAQFGLELPITIRYPRGHGITIDWKQPFSKIEIGKGFKLKKGNDLAVLSIGAIAKNISEAIVNLDVSHYDMRFLKPLDEKLLHNILKEYNTIITIEDNAIKGGFGSAILEFATENNYKNTIKILGIPDAFIEHGTVDELQYSLKLDPESLKSYLTNLIKKRES